MLLIAVISLLIKPKSSPRDEGDMKASLDLLESAADDFASSDDGRLPPPIVDETVRPNKTGAQTKDDDDDWKHDGCCSTRR